MAIEHISDFTAAAGTDLTAITPPVGSALVLGSNGTSEVMKTEGTSIYRDAGGAINAFYIPDTATGDDYDIAFSHEIKTQDSNWLRNVLDMSTVGNTFYSVVWQYDTDNVWACYRRSAGSETQLSGTLAADHDNGDVITGRITRRTESGETKIRLYLDGVLVITWTDASPLTATRRIGIATDSPMTSTTGIQPSGIALMNPGEASFTVSPDEVDADSTGNVITLTGTNTPWDAIQAGFGVSAGTITNVAYNANNDVDITYDAPGSNQTITITCFATGATQTFDVINGENPAVTPGSLTRTAITDVGGSFTWTAASGGTGSITAQLKRSPAGAGTYTNVTGATSSPATDATASPGTSYDYKVVYTDSLSETADSDVETFKTAHAEGFADLLVSDEYRAALSGLTLSILRPTKDSGNPIWPNGGQVGTWDRDIYYPQMIRRGVNDYIMISSVGDGVVPGGKGFICYYTSQDGRTWTRPNLGLHSYSGNTNNNIVVPDVTDDPTPLGAYDGTPEGRTYVMSMVRIGGMDEGGIAVICSEDGITWTEGKVVVEYAGTPAPPTEYQESKGQVLQRSDGTWITYYSQGHFETEPLRQIGAYLSSTSDPRDSWTDQGFVITGTGEEDQRYDMQVIYQSVETWLAVSSKYNENTGILGPMRLYASHDEGLSWTLLDADWIPLGTGSDWESGMFGPGYQAWREGAFTQYGYTGTDHTHGHAGPLDEKIGIATAGHRLFADFAGTGTFITDAIMPSDYLVLQVDATGGGSVDVEILDADDDSVITGYAVSDFTAITGRAIDHHCRWGNNNTLPTGTAIKIKFYITDAALSYELTDTAPAPKPIRRTSHTRIGSRQAQ